MLVAFSAWLIFVLTAQYAERRYLWLGQFFWDVLRVGGFRTYSSRWKVRGIIRDGWIQEVAKQSGQYLGYGTDGSMNRFD